MLNLRTLLTVFTFNLKAEARDYGKGHYIYIACGVQPINALGQLANRSRLWDP